MSGVLKAISFFFVSVRFCLTMIAESPLCTVDAKIGTIIVGHAARGCLRVYAPTILDVCFEPPSFGSISLWVLFFSFPQILDYTVLVDSMGSMIGMTMVPTNP